MEAEATEARNLRKYDKEDIEGQVAAYKQSHPEFFVTNRPHYACGIIVRRNIPEIEIIMVDWYIENVIYSYEDQISLPIVLWRHCMTPGTFPESQYSGRFFTLRNM